MQVTFFYNEGPQGRAPERPVARDRSRRRAARRTGRVGRGGARGVMAASPARRAPAVRTASARGPGRDARRPGAAARPGRRRRSIRVGLAGRGRAASRSRRRPGVTVRAVGAPDGRPSSCPRRAPRAGHLRGRRGHGHGAGSASRSASLSDPDGAAEVAERARHGRGRSRSPAGTRETRTYQVRVGDFRRATRRAGLLAAPAGPAPGGGSRKSAATPARRRPASWRRATSSRGQRGAVAAGDTLSADGLPYRGVLEVRPGEAGLTVVNVINLEDYLKGVVPNELSPDAFPQLEALKAQAVAARTYVLRNRGELLGAGLRHLRHPDLPGLPGQVHGEPALRPGRRRDARASSPTYDGIADQRALHLDLRRPHRDGANIFEGEARRTCVGVACAAGARGLGHHPHHGARPAPWATSRASTATRPCSSPRRPRPRKMYTADGRQGRRRRRRSCATGRRAWCTALKRKRCASPVDGALTRRGTFFRHLVVRDVLGRSGAAAPEPGRPGVPAAASRTAASSTDAR